MQDPTTVSNGNKTKGRSFTFKHCKRACPCYYTRGHANKMIVNKWRSDRDQFLFTVEHAIGGVWPSAGQTESVWFYR